ncbi:hypothetical protein LX69_01829 [Breznakibacter xylanolyticus]|uniref:Uncharacterized protein n=1 Tax=Breznakibacter xylanolyticus TaxID=990 RepID=A0A2W7Q4Y3_9BACT|nr:hypothetical protein LX69_01829 [Breznakibacter xylanolyticus]
MRPMHQLIIKTLPQNRHKKHNTASLFAATGLSIASLFIINHYDWIDLDFKVLAIPILFSSVLFILFSFSFNFFRDKIIGKEGFYFLCTSPVKLILSTTFLLLLKKFATTGFHLVAWIYIIHYLLMLLIDTREQINILKENDHHH